MPTPPPSLSGANRIAHTPLSREEATSRASASKEVVPADSTRDAGAMGDLRREPSSGKAPVGPRGLGPVAVKNSDLSKTKQATVKTYSPGNKQDAMTFDEVCRSARLEGANRGYTVVAARDPGMQQFPNQKITGVSSAETASNLVLLLERARQENKPIAYVGSRSISDRGNRHIDPYIVHPDGHIVALLSHHSLIKPSKDYTGRTVKEELAERGHSLVHARPLGLTTASTASAQTSTSHCGPISVMLFNTYLGGDDPAINRAILVRTVPSRDAEHASPDELEALRKLWAEIEPTAEEKILVPTADALNYSQSGRFADLVSDIVRSPELIVDVPVHRDRPNEKCRSLTLAGARALGMQVSRLDGTPLSDEDIQNYQADWGTRYDDPKNRKREGMKARMSGADLYGEHIMARLRRKLEEQSAS